MKKKYYQAENIILLWKENNELQTLNNQKKEIALMGMILRNKSFFFQKCVFEIPFLNLKNVTLKNHVNFLRTDSRQLAMFLLTVFFLDL